MRKVKLGSQVLQAQAMEAKGDFVSFEGQAFYRIQKVNAMPPFFMTLVSPYDHWLFVASNGGLTAGRTEAEKALFPYYTDDKLIDNAAFTGPRTFIRVENKDDQSLSLWEPFDPNERGWYQIERNLYKSLQADQLVFEEINQDLQLRFAYRWAFSQKHGFVRDCWLENLSDQNQKIECLDGLENLLPYGVETLMQDRRSTLVDAYKKNELEPETALGIFSLSSNIVDKAEPSESLIANVVWSPQKPELCLLNSAQIKRFQQGADLEAETFSKAQKAAWLALRRWDLKAGQKVHWSLVAEVGLSTAKVHNLKVELQAPGIAASLEKEIAQSRLELESLVAKADGLQCSANALVQSRHYSNVLYNIMRGGLFESGYQIDSQDFKQYLKLSNRPLALKEQNLLGSLPAKLTYSELLSFVQKSANLDLRRLASEYLPLSFSRRHGDPSRPWNRFSIQHLDEQGQKILNYEGNWRDIFQNWEALAYSFPAFIEGMIFKFVNASTVDGYNPYHIAKNGIDWEVIEPDDPWSFIGYWGDHQLIYLLRLLEHCEKHYPRKLAGLCNENCFVYADVPYRLKSYAEILQDPQDTILFDQALHSQAESRFKEMGADGKLIWNADKPLRANLGEKIMLSLLTKLYNLVPGGGIWMNTQRPEWNDANNALVGQGLSMVSLYYLRRFMAFMLDWLVNDEGEWHLNSALMTLYKDLNLIVKEHSDKERFSNSDRKDFMDRMGLAGEAYRQIAYSGELGVKEPLRLKDLRKFCERTLELLDRSIAENRKDNALYHAYNLLALEEKEAQIEHLYEMLEGQVAVLSAEKLNPAEALEVLDALKASAMYREDQYSYLLYPDRQLGGFLEKNRIRPEQIEGKQLSSALLEKDVQGDYHFKGQFRNAKDLKAALEKLALEDQAEAVDAEAQFWFELYEQSFVHREFTGRSGTFYGYEGLGSIYWHMVSKLLLAVQENLRAAKQNGASADILGRLIDHYYEIRAGIGANKSPQLYGAFPFDAYSHTPSTAGAQQPGMTGQVKEDVLNRWAELGLEVRAGQLHLDPFFMAEDEFLKEGRSFKYVDAAGQWQSLDLEAGEMAFSYCSVPFIYRKAQESKLRIEFFGTAVEESSELQINEKWSRSLFDRHHEIQVIRVDLPLH
tara:strand:+ start:6174 stop:9587 length:3414 start_codon:yes stop_codon:yes gene_type:complete